MQLQIKVDDKGIISDVRFKTFGCGSAIASSSYMTERVKGLSLAEAGKIRNTEIAKELSLPPVKLHCSMLAEDAIKAAIRDYEAKIKGKEGNIAGSIDVSQSVGSFAFSVQGLEHASREFGLTFSIYIADSQVTTGQTTAEARPGQV